MQMIFKLRLRLMLLLNIFVFLGLSIATQYAVHQFDYDASLGEPLFWYVYKPWSILFWQVEGLSLARSEVFTQSNLLGLLVFLFGICVASVLSYYHHRELTDSDVHGSARFATKEDIETKTNLLFRRRSILQNVLNVEDREVRTGAYVGWYPDKKVGALALKHTGAEHILVIAPTRSGKGISYVLPTLLDDRLSQVIVDIKGELWEQSSGWRSSYVGPCLLFSPGKEGESTACWNAIDYIRKGTKADLRDADTIAHVLSEQNLDGGESLHFKYKARELIQALVLHHAYHRKRPGTLSAVAYTLSSGGDELWQEMMNYPHDVDGKYGWLDPIHKEATSTHPFVGSIGFELSQKEDRELSGIISTASRYLSIFKDVVVAENTRRSDFLVEDLVNREEAVSLYLQAPGGEMQRYGPVLSLLINCIGRRLTEEDHQNQERHRLRFVLDELPTLGKIPVIEEGLAFHGGYGIHYLLIIQDIVQLNRIYGRDNSILSNSHIKCILTPGEIETARLISTWLGESTVLGESLSHSGKSSGAVETQVSSGQHYAKRCLMTPGELMQMKRFLSFDNKKEAEPGETLTLVQGCYPIKGIQVPFWQIPGFRERSQMKALVLSHRFDDRKELPNHYERKGIVADIDLKEQSDDKLENLKKRNIFKDMNNRNIMAGMDD